MRLDEFNGVNAAYVLELYERYKQNPQSVDPQTRQLFDSWTPAADEAVGHAPAQTGHEVHKIVGAANLAECIRRYGHLAAQLDPLGSEPIGDPSLSPAAHAITDADLKALPASLVGGPVAESSANAHEAIEKLRRIYCSTTGFDYAHVFVPEEREWLRHAAESGRFLPPMDAQSVEAVLDRLTQVEVFERFLHRTFPGKTRFSIEGLDMLVPILDEIICGAAEHGARHAVLGMAHRGRLNVLAHVLDKPYAEILAEFKDPVAARSLRTDLGRMGDVKYHAGARTAAPRGQMYITMPPNPSHLEAVDPVAVGMARAAGTSANHRGAAQFHGGITVPILIHGDAAFSGQGIVAETLNLSRLPGYSTGGTIHIIANNQLGFTATPQDSYSTSYASGLARGFKIPIVHVNADDPVACLEAARLAWEYRVRFGLDVLIDLVGYRRYGHNEGDEPSFTQPLMYKAIRKHPTTREIYAKKLIAENVVTEGEVEKMQADWRARLDAELEASQGYKPNSADWLYGRWSDIKAARDADDPRRGHTGASLQLLREIGEKITEVPQGFHVHRTIQRFLENRRKAIETGEGIDWATGEALAFCSLLTEGHPVRLSGQDSERGTFSQRHSVLVDQENEDRYIPFNHVGEHQARFQARFEVINSMLSEEAVLGFEYGYSLAEPNALTLWEAQFGDFANGAQVVFDQFISSGERKWLRMSGIVCLLPHGYEGQGPEHSSARLERYLQMCAEDNMQVANCTTPANYFHILRRQLKRDIRKPLILMTPKSLLRHKRAVSRLDEMGPDTTFHRLLWDDAQMLPDEKIKLVADDKIRRVVMCSGKVYFDLYEEREKRGIDDVYLLRVEQLYPVPLKALVNELGRFPKAQFMWCQEEPRNMGAYTFMEPYLEWVLGQLGAQNKQPIYAGRAASASTAAGQMSQHLKQLKALLDEALA